MERFEKIGYQLMHRSGGGDSAYDAALKDPREAQAGRRPARPGFVSPGTRSASTAKAPTYVADAADRRQASSTATTSWNCSTSARLRKPEIDVLDETTWPVI